MAKGGFDLFLLLFIYLSELCSIPSQNKKLNCLQVLLGLYNPSKQRHFPTIFSKILCDQSTRISATRFPAFLPNCPQSRSPIARADPAPEASLLHTASVGTLFRVWNSPQCQHLWHTLQHFTSAHLKPSIKSNSVHHTVNGIKNTNQKRPYCAI